jgi:hypothetical protein
MCCLGVAVLRILTEKDHECDGGAAQWVFPLESLGGTLKGYSSTTQNRPNWCKTRHFQKPLPENIVLNTRPTVTKPDAFFG